MAGKTKKIDKEFLITDSSVNCYGFRLLTEGYQIDEFKKNPIGYYMHAREDGVIVRWEDLRVDGDIVYGKPVINLSNERGQQCVDEIEGSFLNGASVGHIVALEWSEEPAQMLKGQTGPTITKWYNREASICDVPGNFNALALFDKDGNAIQLTDFKKQTPNMKQIFLTAEQLTKLNLKADSEAAAVELSINDLVAKAAKVDQLTAELLVANTAKDKAVNDLAAEKKAMTDEKVSGILTVALSEKKMTQETADLLKVQYAGRPAELTAFVATLKAYESVVDKTGSANGGKTDTLMAMSYTELDKKGLLENLKANNPEGFKAKYKEQFNKEYIGA